MEATVVILIWGTTFVSTKLLLNSFLPIEILSLRFLLGIACLWLAFPRRLRGVALQQEMLFALAGGCGVFLYYLLENIALTCTTAANVGIIMCLSPFFTAVLAQAFGKGKALCRVRFWCCFALSMAGIALISFKGEGAALSPAGDGLALLASMAWAVYSLLVQRIARFGYPVILTTRRIFCWGLAMMLPLWIGTGEWASLPGRVSDFSHMGNLLFLGIGASALCFVGWNNALRRLGVVQAGFFIYAVPVVTMLSAHWVLGETLSATVAWGCALVLSGLILSQHGRKGED